jgi:hypothetical protein
VDISGPSTVRVDPDTHAHRDGGLALGIAGPILMLVGMVALLGNECWECSAEERERRNDERRVPNTLAGVGLIGGLAITPIGWVMFGTSFKPEVEVDTGAPRATSRALRRSPSLSAVITF